MELTLFEENILKQKFYDDFERANPQYLYGYIGSLSTATGIYGCIDLTIAISTGGEYLYFYPSAFANRIDIKNSIMKAIFMGLYDPTGNPVMPEFGYYSGESDLIMVSVNPTGNYFCLRQNGTILATSNIQYQANTTYVAMLSVNETGTKASLIIGPYTTKSDFSNVKIAITEQTITYPTTLKVPVFGCRNYGGSTVSGRFRYDFWGFSCDRVPIPTT